MVTYHSIKANVTGLPEAGHLCDNNKALTSQKPCKFIGTKQNTSIRVYLLPFDCLGTPNAIWLPLRHLKTLLINSGTAAPDSSLVVESLPCTLFLPITPCALLSSRSDALSRELGMSQQWNPG